MSITDLEATMAGTEGTHEYRVVAESSFGKIGYRLLGDQIRIRLEPANEANAAKIAEVLTREAGWKQPGDSGQNRFSTVVRQGEFAVEVFDRAYALIKRGRPLRYYQASFDYEEVLLGESAETPDEQDTEEESEEAEKPGGGVTFTLKAEVVIDLTVSGSMEDLAGLIESLGVLGLLLHG